MEPAAILLAARSLEGIRENPIGSNWDLPGGPIRVMLALVGITAPASWCAAFVCWCIWTAAGKKWPSKFRHSASALRLWELNPGMQIGKDHVPQPGDVAIYDHGVDVHGVHHGHTDIVVSSTTVSSRPGYAFTVIGGNTNKGGGRQGIGVFSGITRTSSDPLLVGFLRFGMGA